MSRRKKYTGYIYLITNLVNGKKYVGQTLDKGGVKKRWREHKWALRNNRHDNDHLQKAWNKYGEKNFKWEVLHELNFSNRDTLIEALDDLEPMYISIWNLLNDKYGYNISSGGRDGDPHAGKTEEEMAEIRRKQSEAKKGKKHSKETKQKLSEAKKGDKNPIAKKVAQYHISGEYIKTWNCIMDAKRELGVDNTSIVLCCKRQQKSAGGYRWSYLNEDSTIPVLEPLKPSKTAPKPVAMYNLTGEYIRTFNSIADAERELCVDRATIVYCCKGQQRTAGNYRWAYIEDDIIPILEPLKPSKTAPKPVAMLNKETGGVIRVFNSAPEAGRYMGKKFSDNITACCKVKRKTAYGYKWKFVSDLTQEELEQIQEAII